MNELFRSVAGNNSATALPDWVPRRQKIWQIGGGMQCSIVGTCLSHDDLVRVARKCGVKIVDGLSTYDVHGYFVKEAGSNSAIASAIQKLLDKRYAGIIRQLDGCQCEIERARLWAVEHESGRIAGAYWAFLTNTLIGRPLLTRIFGEVHMLSHIHGRMARKDMLAGSELQAKVDHLESKLSRLSERNRVLAGERDQAEADLLRANQLLAARTAVPAQLATGPAFLSGKIEDEEQSRRFQRKERALVATRERARAAERQVSALKERVAQLVMLTGHRDRSTALPCPAADACAEAVRTDVLRRVLYIGGRAGMIEPLRRAAEGAQAELIHHDGGEQQAIARIDGLIEGCDAVFCPIDCISHSACLRAKALCRKLRKPFVPLRSSGAASFKRALSALSAG